MLSLIVIVALAIVFPAFPEAREPAVFDWPQWRGQHGSGVSRETGLPEHWGQYSPEIQWRVAIPGKGRSSPILSGDRVFLTTAVPEMRTGLIFDLLALLLVGFAMFQLTWTSGARAMARYRIPAGSAYLEKFKSLTAWTAWLLFACVTACCLVNDFERINNAIEPFRPMLVLTLFLGGTVASHSLVSSLYARLRWLISGSLFRPASVERRHIACVSCTLTLRVLCCMPRLDTTFGLAT